MKRAPFKPAGVLALKLESWGLDFDALLAQPQSFEERDGVAIVSVSGPLMRCENWLWDSYESISQRVTAALESSCSAVMLKLDSPGGEAAGCFELAREIRTKAKAANKPVVAYVDGQAASAAYAIACGASRIFVPATGTVGSIGCITMIVDQTGLDRAMGLAFSVITSGARKADGNPHLTPSEDAIRASQKTVDQMAGLFFAVVSEARGLTVPAVAALEAAQFMGSAAVDAKLADTIATFDEALAMVASGEAREGAEEDMDEEEKAIAALKALAAGDDEKKAKAAKAALAAMGVGDDEKAEGEEEKPKDEPDGDEKAKAEAPAAKGATDPVLALANRVQELEASAEKKARDEERAKLLASRPDLSPDVLAVLRTAPLATVRTAVKTLAKGPGAKGGGQVAAAQAALHVTPTRGKDAAEGGITRASAEAENMDRIGGLAAPKAAIRHEGTRLIMGVMTPAQARAYAAQKGAAK